MKASAEKSITITKNPRILTKLDAVINSDKTALNLNVGSSDKITFTPTVTGTYDDGTTETLTSGHAAAWSMNPSVSGMTLTNGVLAVSNTTAAGDYTVKISANISSGDVKASAEKSVTVSVNAPSAHSDTTDTSESTGTTDTTENVVTANEIANMTKEEKAAIVVLVIGEDFTDLSMLDEYFTNLETVNFSKAESLETADLSQLPPSVKQVSFVNNTGIKSLNLGSGTVEEIDASGCENLTSVDLAGNKTIVSINLSGGTNITELNAAGCENLKNLVFALCGIDESSFNFADCVNLEHLDFAGNKFKRFDYDSNVLKALTELVCDGQKAEGGTFSRSFSFGNYFTNGSVKAADNDPSFAANITNLKGYDAEGNEIELISYDKETGDTEFAETPSSISYDYITGFNDMNMGVELSGTASEEDEDAKLGSSGGGCDSGFGLMILGALLILTRKR